MAQVDPVMLPEINPGDAIMLERPDRLWDVFLIDGHGESMPWMNGLKAQGIAYEVARTAMVPGGRVWLCSHQTPDQINEYTQVH